MTNTLTKTDNLQFLESVLIQGDLSQLSQSDRVGYYERLCESLGLNPLTVPFAYIRLNGKLKLYALREATEQLRKIHHVSVRITSRELIADSIYLVTAQASLPDGRCDESIGAVSIANLQGEALALQNIETKQDILEPHRLSILPINHSNEDVLLCPNITSPNAVMKAETKSKRRVTLSICGLAFLDETEVDSIPHTQRASGIEPSRTDSEVWKQWSSPSDALFWAEKQLPNMSSDEIGAEFDALEPDANGKKAPAWFNRVNQLMLEQF